MQHFPRAGDSEACPFVPDARIYRMSIGVDGGQQMELLLIKAGVPFDAATLGQVMDATRICINIWGRRHGEIAIHELVRAILQDEPLKMHRLAEIFHVDVASLHEMWIVQSDSEDAKQRFQSCCRRCANALRALPAPSSWTYTAGGCSSSWERRRPSRRRSG